ncbi:MAG: ABC transporter permease, partial [Rhodopirellula sp. JB044]
MSQITATTPELSSHGYRDDQRETIARKAADPKPHLVIEPVSGWRSLRLGDIWEFRDLLFTLGMRDVKLVYNQTLLGVAWVVL